MKPFPIAVRDLARRSLLVLTLLVMIGTVGVWLGTEILAEIHFRKAQSALEDFDFPLARRHLQSCLALRPNRFQYHFTAAQTERRAGFYEEALHHLNRCQELAGDNADISSLEKTLLHAQQGGVAEVENPLWRLVEENHPDKALILEALARGYVRIYSLPLAQKALKLLLDDHPGYAEAWFLRGGIAELLGEPLEGRKCYKRAVELRPDNDTYRLGLAKVLLSLSQAAEVLPHLEKLREHQPDNAEALAGLGRAMSQLGKKDQSRDLFQRALAIEPHNAQALAELARLDLDEGNLAQAENGLEKAIQADPTDRINQFRLFQCLEREGKKEAARRQHERWQALEKDLTRLESIVRHDLPKNPRSADLYTELGTLFNRYGKTDRARFAFQQALAFDPQHAGAQKALHQLGP
jgi:tetratricopeptide (TPR) repeat protein